MIQVTVMLFMFDLKISKCCMATVAPVNNVITAVDKTLMVQCYKDLAHGS